MNHQRGSHIKQKSIALQAHLLKRAGHLYSGVCRCEGTDKACELLRRNPGYWSQPDEFDPDRFSMEGPVPSETTENFNYLPFGGGRRKCIGTPPL